MAEGLHVVEVGVLALQQQSGDWQGSIPQAEEGEPEDHVGEERWDRAWDHPGSPRVEGDVDASAEIPFSIASWVVAYVARKNTPLSCILEAATILEASNLHQYLHIRVQVTAFPMLPGNIREVAPVVQGCGHR